MSDCDHVWMVHSITRIPLCLKCHEEMGSDETERRLKATQCLNAWTAKYAATLIHSDAEMAQKVPLILFEYADVLEAKE